MTIVIIIIIFGAIAIITANMPKKPKQIDVLKTWQIL